MSNSVLERKAHLFPLHEGGIWCFIFIFTKYFTKNYLRSKPTGDAQINHIKVVSAKYTRKQGTPA